MGDARTNLPLHRLSRLGPVLVASVLSIGGACPLAGQAANPKTYGTQSTGYVTVDASDFSPVSTDVTYKTGPVGLTRYLTNYQGIALMAPIHLPSGSLVTFMGMDCHDTSASGQVLASLAVCDFTGQNCVYEPGGCGTAATLCSSVEGALGNTSVGFFIQGDSIVVDNYFHRYFVVAGNTTNDGQTAISQVIVGYLLQVSPAPPTASFTDVPTSHPFFQYVEALLASGITAGCGGFTYCPDAPLTRGQMAVFLSKALGLQWP